MRAVVGEALRIRGLAGLVWVLRRLGPAWSSNVVGALCRAVGPVLPVSRVARTNLLVAFPDSTAAWRRRVVRDMWDGLGRTAGEFPHLADLRQGTEAGPGWVAAGEPVLAAQARRGGAVVFVSAHIGNWEMLPVAAASYGLRFSGIYRPASSRAVDDAILALRRRAMGHAVPMFAKGATGAREALGHLRRGGQLGMLVDQKMNDGIEARLFGRPAMTAPAAAALALRFGCPVIPAHVERLGPARLRLVVEHPIALPDTGNRQADILALTQAINDQLERWIRTRPESWLWLHRRFEKDLYR